MSEISEDERTNCVGLYSYGVSYRRPADALGTIKSELLILKRRAHFYISMR